MKKLWLLNLMVILVILSACQQQDADMVDATVAVEPTGEIAPLDEGDPVEENGAPMEEAAVEPTPLPVEPLAFRFVTNDGATIDGDFYPPAYPNAPVVILMHQYPMDHNIEWIAIAPWLQNRDMAASVRSGGEPWTDPSWFSPMNEGFDFAVFTFTFRNCLGGCKEDSVESREEWINDASAAIEAVASFRFVDPSRILVVGTSIGADAAVNACERMLEIEGINCSGVVSISPGSYLEQDFASSVESLTQAGIPVRCVASEGDALSAQTCQDVEGTGYQAVIADGNEHGVRLFDPSLNIDLSALLKGWLIEWAYIY